MLYSIVSDLFVKLKGVTFDLKLKTKKMKKVIEQIKELKGVKTVESMSDKVVVTFEPDKKLAIKVSTIEQVNFLAARTCDNRPHMFDINARHLFVIDKDNWYQDYRDKLYNNISFTQYIKDYNLKSEWEEYLIDEAKKRYPVGTKFRVVHNGKIKTVS